ncbi:MAG: hypothetical protein ACLRSW_08785 [Christensenellaceae bacterium]
MATPNTSSAPIPRVEYSTVRLNVVTPPSLEISIEPILSASVALHHGLPAFPYSTVPSDENFN